MRLLIGVAAVMLLTASAAQAKDEPPKTAEKLVCKRVYGADLGSHFQTSKRVCHTALEWKELEDVNNRSLQTMRDNGGSTGVLSTGGFGGGGPQ